MGAAKQIVRCPRCQVDNLGLVHCLSCDEPLLDPPPVRVVAVSFDGKPIVTGRARESVTLDVVLAMMPHKEADELWLSLYATARKMGVRHTRMLAMLEPSVETGNLSDEVINRLETVNARLQLR